MSYFIYGLAIFGIVFIGFLIFISIVEPILDRRRCRRFVRVNLAHPHPEHRALTEAERRMNELVSLGYSYNTIDKIINNTWNDNEKPKKICINLPKDEV